MKPIGGFPPTYYHTGQETISLERNLEETIFELEEKELGDDSAYYILDLRISKNHPIATNIIRKLNSKVLIELDENKVLVTSTLGDFRDAKVDILKLKTIRSYLFAIRQLRFSDIVDPELETGESAYLEPKALTFHLVPNIGADKATKYISQTGDYLKSHNVQVESSWIDPQTGSSSVNACVTRSQLLDLIEKSSFLFKVHEKIIISTIKQMTQYSTRDVQISQLDKDQIKALPEICIIDTGVNIIPQLSGLVAKRVAEPPITSVDDLNNHGTPVACLAIYGSSLSSRSRTIVPLARVISHKILSPNTISNMAAALSNAMNQNTSCRTFSCSLCFKGTLLAFMISTQQVNTISQSSNRAVVFSAGNIEHDDLVETITGGVDYPDYLSNAHVSHPSDAPFVFSVGACTKYSLPNSLAPVNAPSPFTTFGTNIKQLKECPKPELVEHGGNVCCVGGQLNYSGTGVETFSNTGQTIERIGTSLAAPLVAQHMTRIWNRFNNDIKNVETVKAILLSTCSPTLNHPRFVGFGEPCKDELFHSRNGVARVIFEGNIPLTAAAVRGMSVIPADEVKVFVPADIKKIELFLVHSDNYKLNAFPKLNTFLKVSAEKPGKSGSVRPKLGNPSSQTYIKYLMYEYERNIKGDWFFRISPTMMSIAARERKQVLIRYGGVIKMTAKTARSGVTLSVVQGLRRGRRIQIPLDSSS